MDDEDIWHYTGGRVENERITKVVVQDGVQAIDDKAFEECPELRSITIPNSVTSIGDYAFDGLEELETISIPDSVKTIGDSAFSWCKSLKAIVIPEGVTEIAIETFWGCESLESITFPKSLTKTGPGAFTDCKALEQVDIPKGIKIIEDDSFDGCLSLHTATLPPTIEEFGVNAFRGCVNLENFIIPNGLPALEDGFDPFQVGFDFKTWKVVTQILQNASSLTRMTLKTKIQVQRHGIKGDNLLKVLELVSACPTLREVDLSRDNLSVGVFEKLVSQDIPGHLRLLQIKGRSEDPEIEQTQECCREREERRREWEEASSSPKHLIRVLELNPKLVIETDKFWDDSEDRKVRHQLDMNEYGCRGFTLRDSRWPEFIETLAVLEKEQELRTAASNILYHLLHRHLDRVLLTYQQRHKNT